MSNVCALTGHRDLDEDFDCAALEKAVISLIERGIKTFYCGMARGFDLVAAECVLSHADLGAQLVACVPCEGQENRFSRVDKVRYSRILDECAEKKVLAPHYYCGCMLKRDEFMVDSCEVLVAYLRKKKGGTYYTVRYAAAQGKEIIYI